MPEWVNWSENFRRPVRKIIQPSSLSELQDAVRHVTGQEGRIHAQGSKWAFSAPAYCEDTIIDTDLLNSFPKQIQYSIIRPDREPGRLLVAVEAGIKIHDLYHAIAFDSERDYMGPRPLAVPPELTTGRIWTLPVLGGAGGQGLAGVINTGTHGGDAARPPLSDAVQAMLIVIANGQLLLLEPDSSQEQPIVDPSLLEQYLGQSIITRYDTGLFNAALVSVGRFGVVWAYVLEVRDETEIAIVETRTQTSWEAFRGSLVSEVMNAAAADEFLQLVINPYHSMDFTHACYVTRHRMVIGGHPTDSDRFPALPHVTQARQTSISHFIFQALGSDEPIQFVNDVIEILRSAMGLEAPVVIYALERLGHVGIPRPSGRLYVTGDWFADVIEFLTTLGRSDVIAPITRRMIDIEQRDQLAGPFFGPWEVKGTRFEIADFYNYGATAYLGESLELFFPVNPTHPTQLPTTINSLLRVFAVLRAERQPIASYVSLRFMEATRATLGLAKWSPTCSVEIAMLRGLRGNDRALRLFQEVCLARGGLVHWGQQHDIDPRDLDMSFGPALNDWRNQLYNLHASNILFSSPFTRQRNLEVNEPSDWSGWVDLGFIGRGAPVLPIGFTDVGSMQIFARDDTGIIQSQPIRRDGTPDCPWRSVRPEGVHGPLVAFRGNTGRLELFAIDDGFLKHTYQEDVMGTTWSGWDIKGYPAPIRYDNDEKPVVSVTAHSDGRLETFGRASYVDDFRLAHCWQNVHDAFGWSTVWHRGTGSLAAPPSAVNRRLPDGSDHLVVVSTNAQGVVQSMHQDSPADDAGWTDWQALNMDGIELATGAAVVVAPATGPLHIFAVGSGDRVFYAVDISTEITPSWSPWTQLDLEVDPQSRLAVVATTDHIWVAARTLARQVACWDFVPGTLPRGRYWNAFTTEDVALAAYPGEDSVYLAARDLQYGRLFGQRLEPSP